ncbi:universal stress protein [Pseudarthrobacter sp. P1]|uniref:universal stress protein n=1 Tax=Pseudarthrobacter sp. P1 TaxID=3418418 RepID=UPI003CF8C8BD
MTEKTPHGRPQPVVVGVHPGQPAHVLRTAAAFALRFGAELLCAYANPGRFPVSEDASGTVATGSIDPDFEDQAEESFDPALAARLAALLADTGLAWRPVLLAGDAATALGHLADTVDAAMIIVGTHQRSPGSSLHDFFARSVATQLAHKQSRPVVVVPAHAHEATPLIPGTRG